MYLTSLTLENFRSHQKSSFTFDPKINLIIGPNGSGKSNLLESIFFLAHLKSFRSSTIRELISWQQAYSIIRATNVFHQNPIQLEIKITSLPLQKKLFIGSVNKTRKTYIGHLQIVAFQPEDIRLVAGSPTRRRDFLDSVFLQSEWRYHQALIQYHKALRHRNELLNLINSGQASSADLFYWDQSLVKNSEIIFHYRQSFIQYVNSFFKNHSFDKIRSMSLTYRPSTLTSLRLSSSLNLDLSTGFTHFGPHRDDFSFDNSLFGQTDNNVATWGSRGQQRLAVLALRLAQIDYFYRTFQQKPILLLDDIFSELDAEHQKLVISLTTEFQTIFTSAEKSIKKILPNAKIISLS